MPLCSVYQNLYQFAMCRRHSQCRRLEIDVPLVYLHRAVISRFTATSTGDPLARPLSQRCVAEVVMAVFLLIRSRLRARPGFPKTYHPKEKRIRALPAGRTPTYLTKQQNRLPSHKYRPLHLNLPGSPDGSAYSAEKIIDSVERGVSVRLPVRASPITTLSI